MVDKMMFLFGGLYDKFFDESEFSLNFWYCDDS